jgi:hypothetical protein
MASQRVWASFVMVGFALSAGVSLAAACGDVVGSGDGVKTSDALAVLRRSVGQSVSLTCESPQSQYSRVRVHGLDGCSDTKFKASTGETLTASEVPLNSRVNSGSRSWIK